MYKTKTFKQFVSMMLALSIAIVFCLPVSAYYTENSNSGALSDGYYTIRALCNGKYLDANSTQIQIWDKDSKRNQAFYFSRVGNSWVIFTNSSNRAIAVDGYEDRSVLIQQDYTGASNQQWDVVYNSDNTYSFVNSNSGKYMDVYNGDSANGTRMIQFYSHGGINQKFELQKVNVEPNYNSIDYTDPYGPYDPDDIEISIYDDDDDDDYYLDYIIVNYTNYDLDDLTYDTLPEENTKYLAEISYLDEDDVYDKIADKNHIPAAEYKKFYEVATKGKSTGVNPVIRKIYVTFQITYSGNRIYITQAKKYVKYLKWSKNNAKKTQKEMQTWTEIY